MDESKFETERTNSSLVFMGVILFFVLIGYIVKTCASMPNKPDPSIECAKVPGNQWFPESYAYDKENRYGNKIQGYCGKIPKPAASQ